ncbi:MAG: NADH-quinone oxidoreductase subunit N [Cytophagales bacterium CG12_big_fil_rev_8_21_14_0_65_40_12]|nr:MAG: NADH-quinone oxidoreductase subunit N [Cytophagales bacterium CG12_big_fil_rev_8_21_14_0_65_40_12]PIW04812.1 MAG: NADH-quinone oxidoreductase subunit N [Cytophagales bacterium CG17_big_fil_post_rev_8_21_14_2_50_40_13]
MILAQSNMLEGLKDQLQHLTADIFWLAPEVTLVITLVLLLTYDLIFRQNKSVGIVAIAIAGLAFSTLLLISNWSELLVTNSLMGGLLRLDQGAVFFKLLFVVGALLAIVMMQRHRKKDFFFHSSEPLVLVFGLLLGVFLMTMAANLLMVYVSVELVSICSYLLIGLYKKKSNSEAAIKYLLFGAVASAVMIYGMSWLYGFTGTLDFTSVQFVNGLYLVPILPLSIALVMTMAGFVFKLGAFPFHIWSPDVYEATPTPFVALLSALPKLAGLTLIFRFVQVLDLDFANWQLWLGIIAIASMTIGNFSALWQKDAKRMLAYSSIAQAGFLLVGLIAFSESGETAALFYGVIYLIMNFAVFFLIQLFENKEGRIPFDNFRGKGNQEPWIGALLLIVMISLTGLPPTAGFNGKLFVFSALWESWNSNGQDILLWVFIFGLLNTVVSLFYYLKIPYFMFVKRPVDELSLNNKPQIDRIWGTILVCPLLIWFFKSDGLLNILNSINFVF